MILTRAKTSKIGKEIKVTGYEDLSRRSHEVTAEQEESSHRQMLRRDEQEDQFSNARC